MSAIADSANGFDHDRLRVVTRYFRELQGLYLVNVGIVAAAVKLFVFWTGPSLVPKAALAISLAGMVISLAYLPGYYRTRFGAVEQFSIPKIWNIHSAAYLAVSVTLLVLEDRLHAHYDISFTSLCWWWAAPGGLFLLRPELTRLRRNYFVPLFLGAVFVTLYPMWHTLDSGHAALWKILVDLAMPVFLMITGLCDHLLLLRLMPKRVSEDDYDG
jgi:hypothetical protein